MNLAQWLQVIWQLIFVAWPIIFVIALHIDGLPERQRKALAQFAPTAVHRIQQQSKALSGTAKKQLAMVAVAKSFKSVHLPPLPEDIVSDAIEAAVLLLPCPPQKLEE
jgi:Bacteriophage holin of superfamily 6 (Holin_LLH)